MWNRIRLAALAASTVLCLAGTVQAGCSIPPNADAMQKELLAHLNAERKAINGSRVLVLGVAYKRDVSDVRESPALDVIHLLGQRGAEVTYHDPYVASLRREGIDLDSIDLTTEALAAASWLAFTDFKARDRRASA